MIWMLSWSLCCLLQASKIAETAAEDERKLNSLGYKQELQRKLTYFHNFAVAFTYLSPITGLTGSLLPD